MQHCAKYLSRLFVEVSNSLCCFSDSCFLFTKAILENILLYVSISREQRLPIILHWGFLIKSVVSSSHSCRFLSPLIRVFLKLKTNSFSESFFFYALLTPEETIWFDLLCSKRGITYSITSNRTPSLKCFFLNGNFSKISSMLLHSLRFYPFPIDFNFIN